ncbi:MAG: class I SAM-dependent methyltransferase, partial [Candidatus Promineifilaceae bacterium]
MRASQPARAWAGLVRLGFQLLYNDCAWAYDAVAWLVSEGQWRAWGQAAIPLLAGRQILEIGHGPGHLLLELAGGGYSVTGVDVSAAMGRIAG